jgi:hypothetical protein
MPTIQGHKTVEIEKDDVHCKWLVKSPKGDIIYEVSFRYAFDHERITKEEFYTALYTSLCHAPLTDADREETWRRFPDLRYKPELEVEPYHRVSVQSTKAETPKPSEKKTGGGKKSFRRKVDL